ncbi:hypothetical protein [Neisseria sicca]
MFAKFIRRKAKRCNRGKIRLVHVFDSIQEASLHADSLINSGVCVNIVRDDGKFAVQTVVWQ